MPTQLLGQNTGCGSGPISGINILNFLSGGVTPQNFFFYSNNPEDLTDQIADNGIYLNHATLHGGPGQIFYWHSNSTGGPIASAIYLENPNPSDVIVTIWKQGLLPLEAVSGVEAWFKYYTPRQLPSLRVPANGAAVLFPQPAVPANAIFGGVANISIGPPGSTIDLDIYDIVYQSLPAQGSLVTQAPRDTSLTRRRGTGNGYSAGVNLTMDLLNVVQAGPLGFTIGSQDDSIGSPSGADLVIVTDPDGTTASLAGNYGVQYSLNWVVSNSDTVPHTFRLYGGNYNTGGATNFIINWTAAPGAMGLGGCRNPTPPLTPGPLPLPGNFLPFISDTLPANSPTVSYQFQLGTVGGFSYPLALVLKLDS